MRLLCESQSVPIEHIRIQQGRSGRRALICPSGSFEKSLSSPFGKNNSLRATVEAALFILPSRAREEGRIAIVTNVGRGMRWAVLSRETGAPKANGKAVWS
jgi:hypothetical protein